MSRRAGTPTKKKQPQPSMKKSERVMNESEEAVRTHKLAMRNKDDEIEKQELLIQNALKANRLDKAKFESRQLVRLRQERKNMESQVDRLCDGQSVYRDTMGEMRVQQHLSQMSKETTRLFQTTDMADLYEAGTQSDWHEEGLAELRAITSPSEEKQSQRDEEVERVMTEMRAQMESSNNTNTSNNINESRTTNRATTTTRQSPSKATSGKYSRANDLLTYL